MNTRSTYFKYLFIGHITEVTRIHEVKSHYNAQSKRFLSLKSIKLIPKLNPLKNQNLARCLAKEEWVAAQSIKIIGNTAIPVVKLKTQIISPLPHSEDNFNGIGSASEYARTTGNLNSEDKNGNTNSDKSTDKNSAPFMDSAENARSASGRGNAGGNSRSSAVGSVVSLDISFEGPGHYGLEANKMITSLIKVRRCTTLCN